MTSNRERNTTKSANDSLAPPEVTGTHSSVAKEDSLNRFLRVYNDAQAIVGTILFGALWVVYTIHAIATLCNSSDANDSDSDE